MHLGKTGLQILCAVVSSRVWRQGRLRYGKGSEYVKVTRDLLSRRLAGEGAGHIAGVQTIHFEIYLMDVIESLAESFSRYATTSAVRESHVFCQAPRSLLFSPVPCPLSIRILRLCSFRPPWPHRPLLGAKAAEDIPPRWCRPFLGQSHPCVVRPCFFAPRCWLSAWDDKVVEMADSLLEVCKNTLLKVFVAGLRRSRVAARPQQLK